LRAALFTREYPPHVYGGAGVHVEYLSRELSRLIEVEVRCWGEQRSNAANLHVIGAEPWAEITNGTTGKFKGALEALSLNLTQIKALSGVDIAHTHTWYVAMAGFLAKKLYGIPFVLTVHSLEPLRAWKAEQLGSGYAMSSWMEKAAILDADAVIAVSNGTREDILRAYPDIESILPGLMSCSSAGLPGRRALPTWSTRSNTCLQRRRSCCARARRTLLRSPKRCGRSTPRRIRKTHASSGSRR
jgi:starch synthase